MWRRLGRGDLLRIGAGISQACDYFTLKVGSGNLEYNDTCLTDSNSDKLKQRILHVQQCCFSPYEWCFLNDTCAKMQADRPSGHLDLRAIIYQIWVMQLYFAMYLPEYTFIVNNQLEDKGQIYSLGLSPVYLLYPLIPITSSKYEFPSNKEDIMVTQDEEELPPLEYVAYEDDDQIDWLDIFFLILHLAVLLLILASATPLRLAVALLLFSLLILNSNRDLLLNVIARKGGVKNNKNKKHGKTVEEQETHSAANLQEEHFITTETGNPGALSTLWIFISSFFKSIIPPPPPLENP